MTEGDRSSMPEWLSARDTVQLIMKSGIRDSQSALSELQKAAEQGRIASKAKLIEIRRGQHEELVRSDVPTSGEVPTWMWAMRPLVGCAINPGAGTASGSVLHGFGRWSVHLSRLSFNRHDVCAWFDISEPDNLYDTDQQVRSSQHKAKANERLPPLAHARLDEWMRGKGNAWVSATRLDEIEAAVRADHSTHFISRQRIRDSAEAVGGPRKRGAKPFRQNLTAK